MPPSIQLQEATSSAPAVTERDQSLPKLAQAQTVAVAALAAGATHLQAAKLAGVHRVTVSRWVERDPGVIAAMDSLRESAEDQLRARLANISALALDAIEAALLGGDVSTAFRWLGAVAHEHMATAPIPFYDPSRDLKVERSDLDGFGCHRELSEAANCATSPKVAEMAG